MEVLNMMIGIDLGTTNSLVGVFKDGKAELIPNPFNEWLTPSVVSIDEDGSVLVGRPAKERLYTHPDRSASIFKRHMGTAKNYRLAGRDFRAEELSALVLKSLKADAEAFIGEPVSEAIITVPAYFNDAQRKATKQAGELAGLKVERLLNEPTAAALAYGLHEAEDMTTFLVFDLGGGTFDVSLLELFDGVMEVHASAGDNQLGGEDFLEPIFRGFIEAHGKAMPEHFSQLSKLDQQKFRGLAERLKLELSEQEQASMTLLYKDQPLTWELSKANFEKRCEPLLERLREPVMRALRDASIRPQDLDAVVLVGGATRMPMIHRLAGKMLGKLPRRDLHPDHAIAIGAVIQAGLKSRDQALKEVVLTDVCPYTLGTAAVTGLGNEVAFVPIIERNTVVPISIEHSFSNVSDNQRKIDVLVFQGESRFLENNIKLGVLHVDIPPRPANELEILIRFTYDINGLLEVEVTIPATKVVKRLVIEENPGSLTKDEVEKRLEQLKDLKIHPRELVVNREVLARADRWYQQTLGEKRQYLSQVISAFQAVLEGQDPIKIERQRKETEAFLNELEKDFYQS
jgi:molecular chaperone HscC